MKQSGGSRTSRWDHGGGVPESTKRGGLRQGIDAQFGGERVGVVDERRRVHPPDLVVGHERVRPGGCSVAEDDGGNGDTVGNFLGGLTKALPPSTKWPRWPASNCRSSWARCPRTADRRKCAWPSRKARVGPRQRFRPTLHRRPTRPVGATLVVARAGYTRIGWVTGRDKPVPYGGVVPFTSAADPRANRRGDPCGRPCRLCPH